MRARDMMTKLDRLPAKTETVKVWDLSLLSPADQDRADELMDLFGCADDLEAKDMQGAIAEFTRLVEGLPMLARDEPEGGPSIEVPHDLANYWIWSQKASEWRHYSFTRLGKVQTLRFVELCRSYGYEDDETSLPVGDRTRQVKQQMIPMSEWVDSDRAELVTLLDISTSNSSKVSANSPRKS